MEMRKCKECGKLFQPKGREQYCSDLHYRPCPICGEPVEAKYLSDPPRTCVNCRGKKRVAMPTPSKSDAEVNTAKDRISNYSSEETLKFFENECIAGGRLKCVGVPLKYVGPEIKPKFIVGHVYEVNIRWNFGNYLIWTEFDMTDQKEVSLSTVCGSKASITRYFSL